MKSSTTTTTTSDDDIKNKVALTLTIDVGSSSFTVSLYYFDNHDNNVDRVLTKLNVKYQSVEPNTGKVLIVSEEGLALIDQTVDR